MVPETFEESISEPRCACLISHTEMRIAVDTESEIVHRDRAILQSQLQTSCFHVEKLYRSRAYYWYRINSSPKALIRNHNSEVAFPVEADGTMRSGLPPRRGKHRWQVRMVPRLVIRLQAVRVGALPPEKHRSYRRQSRHHAARCFGGRCGPR